MKKAFSYMFQDDAFKKKALIFWILTVFVTFLNMLVNLYSENINNIDIPVYMYVYACIAIPVSLLLDGYLYSCIQTITQDKENIILPFINFKKDMIKGLKLVCAKFLIGLIFTLCFIGFVTLFYIIYAIGLKLLANILTFIMVVLFILLVLIYSLSMVITFAKTEMITSFLRFPRATLFIKENCKDYFKTLGILAGIGFCIFISNIIFMIPLIFLIGNNVLTAFLTSLFLSVLTSYMVFVSAYLIANLVKTTEVKNA